jgi:molybdate transport system substrate-binding protein
LRVFAAASLTESFGTLAEEFEEQHPGTRVELNFGPSSGLAEQVRGGAPADGYAAACLDPMDALVEDGLAADPRDFASNRLAIAVPIGNPGGVRGLADLADDGLKLAVCQPQVPCGKVAASVLDAAGLDVRPATEEVDVKGVLTKVELGEVDAGLVYETDVRAAEHDERTDVAGIGIPEEQNASTTYPIATLIAAERRDLARAFVDLAVSPTGRQVLADAGFGPP